MPSLQSIEAHRVQRQRESEVRPTGLGIPTYEVAPKVLHVGLQAVQARHRILEYLFVEARPVVDHIKGDDTRRIRKI